MAISILMHAQMLTTFQLVDHYEGSLILSQLELVTLALECLHNRDTEQYLPGDISYALMGLLRVRPQIDSTDSAFQAFARYVRCCSLVMLQFAD